MGGCQRCVRPCIERILARAMKFMLLVREKQPASRSSLLSIFWSNLSKSVRNHALGFGYLSLAITNEFWWSPVSQLL